MPWSVKFFVDFQRGIVESEFDDGKIGCRGLKVIAEAEVGELKFGLIEIGERFAEVDQHEVALVADEREQGGLAGGILLHGGEDVGGFFGDRRFFGGGQGAPGGPAEAHHLVQDAVAFGGERDGGDLRCDLRTRLVSGGHASLFPNGALSSEVFRRKKLLYAVGRRVETCAATTLFDSTGYRNWGGPPRMGRLNDCVVPCAQRGTEGAGFQAQGA